ncbi:MAG: TSCPD domain-containing protein, partial [Candidatus Heimdallarchaeota archaeon]|nr:TSCPD domain-containing protein [Candidatus Heimdallarchaeota archaeon]
ALVSVDCGEQPLLPYESCNLGSINLSRHVTNGSIDWTLLEETVRSAVLFLDNVIDKNRYVLPEIEEMTKGNRKIGLGVMGFADLLVKLVIVYDSKEALTLAEEIMSFIQKIGLDESIKLGKEKGSFPNFKHSIFKEKHEAMRNATITTIAPTGTISLIAGNSSGIEPYYAVAYTRNVLGGEKLFDVNPLFESIAKERGFYSKELIEEIASRNSIKEMDEIPEDVRKIFTTSHDLTPEWHIKLQAAFQKHVDNATSKCLHENTLMLTNKGIISIKECGVAKGDDSFDKPIENLQVVDGNHSDLKEVSSHYSAGMKSATSIRLRNGSTLTGATETHRLLTPNGWKRLNDLKKGDFVCVKHKFPKIHTQGRTKIDFNYEFKTSSKKIYIPTEMSADLALWLGMLAADGSLTDTTGAVSFHEKNQKIGEIYDEIVRKIFDLKPRISIDKRTGVKSHIINSRTLERFTKELIGKGAYNKHVPKQILQGNSKEKISFIRGVTLDGFNYKQGGLVVYNGMSKRLAYELAELLRSFGLPLIYQGMKRVKGYGMSYYVEISNELLEIIEPLEQHKKSKIYFKKYFVQIDPKEVADKKLLSNHQYYSNLRWLKKSKRNYCWNTVAKELDLKIISSIEKIDSIELSGYAKMYDIEVAENHSYLVNGIVSHNTINFPSSATKEDIAKAFILAYKNDCKGITVYRDGSRKYQVLSTKKKEKEEKPSLEKLVTEENGRIRGRVEPRDRPNTTLGKTHKVRSGCGNLYVTVNRDEYGVCEVFVSVGKSGGCIASQSEAVGRLISLALRSGVKLNSVARQLVGIRCPNPSFYEGNTILSCADGIAHVLEKYTDGNKIIRPNGTIACPDCGGMLEFSEGCYTCRGCGYSKCD